LQLDVSAHMKPSSSYAQLYEGWNFNSGNYLFTTDTK